MRVTMGNAGVRMHIVREGTDPLDTLCGRAWPEANPRELDPRSDLLTDTKVCRSCLKCLAARYVSKRDLTPDEIARTRELAQQHGW